MFYYKKFDNGLRLVVNKMEGLTSVSFGVMVKAGSANESKELNGISHFIEHTTFKGTKKRAAFDISDRIDGIGAQINAFTSKEMTCYYTKSTAERFEDAAEVVSDIFFDSVFKEEELEKEKCVIVEEINMSEDSPEDLCLDALAESYFGKKGYGRTILGSAKNVRSFTKKDVLSYMDKYYTADNVVISVAGNIDFVAAENVVQKYFADKFKRVKSQVSAKPIAAKFGSIYKRKRIEQTHIGLAYKAFSVKDDRGVAFSIANAVLGGGMSSRLFQRIREEMGLCYTVYSYPSLYEKCGVLEIYAGVNSASREKAAAALIAEFGNFVKNGVTKSEFERGKEQVKSAFIIGRESTASQMLLYGKHLLFTGKNFDYDKELKNIEKTSVEEINDVIKAFDIDKFAFAAVGADKKPLTV